MITHDPAQIAALREAVEYAGSREVLLVVAAGNDGVDLDNDENCMYPECFDFDHVIRVAELDYEGNLVRYQAGDQWRGSNYGVKRVEIGAIAETISTHCTHGRSTYAAAGGTSNAAPVVAGVAALVLSVHPTLTAKELKTLLMDTATPVESLAGRIASGGAVSAYQAVRKALALD